MSNEVIARLKELKLHGMASSWAELYAQSRHTEFDPERFMQQLLLAEGASAKCARLVTRWRQPASRRTATSRASTSRRRVPMKI